MTTIWTAISTLFNSKTELIGFCIDTPNGIAKAMLEDESIQYALSPSLDKIYRQADLVDRMCGWNDAESGLVQPKFIKHVNKLMAADLKDEATIRLLEGNAKAYSTNPKFLALNFEYKIVYTIQATVRIVKGFRKLLSAIEKKDVAELESLLWYQNKTYRAYFEEETGILLGKTDKSMHEALKKCII